MTDKRPIKKRPPATPKNQADSARPGFNGAVYRQPDKIIDAATGRTLLIDAILKQDKNRIERLLLSGANPAKSDKSGKSPLHYAARLGQLETAKLLQQQGAQINPRDKFLSTPLFEALEGPRPLEMLEYLLKAGGDANIADNKSRVPLHTAAQKCGKDVILCLAQATENPGRPDKTGVTSLHEACQKNGLEAVQALLSLHVSVFSATNEGDTPLHFAASRKEGEVAKYLLTTEAAQLVNAVNLNGQTPLHLAVTEEKAELTEQMLLVGGNANLADRKGMTALHIAADHGNEAIVLLLIRNGADVSKGALPGKSTPLWEALSSNKMAVVRILLDYDASPNIAARGDQSPLLQAVQMRSTEAVALLLKAGANPDFINQRGQTALHSACSLGLEKEVRMLLAYHANPNIPNFSGRTPLHLLVDAGASNIALVSLLLEAGADPLVKDQAGITAFDLAFDRGKNPVLELFKKKLDEKGVSYTPKRPPRMPPGWEY